MHEYEVRLSFIVEGQTPGNARALVNSFLEWLELQEHPLALQWASPFTGRKPSIREILINDSDYNET